MENPDGTLTRRARVALYPQVVLCALGAALTATLYGSFFAGRGYLPPLAAMALIGAVAGFGAAVSAARRPAHSGIRVITHVVVFVVVFAVADCALVLRSRLSGGVPDLGTLRAGWDGLSGGWASMLSISTPAPVEPQLMMTPAAVTFAAAFAAGAFIPRRHAVLAQAAVLLPAEIIALLFASDQSVGHLAQAAALLAVLAVLAVLRADPARGSGGAGPGGVPPRRRVMRTAERVGVVLVIVGAGAGVVAALPIAQGAERYDPHYRPVLSLPPTISPLSSVRAQLQTSPAGVLFTVHVEAPAGVTVDRVQTTTLDQFDGADWTSTDSFEVSGDSLTPGPALPDADEVTLDVSIAAGFSGPFLPAFGRPTGIDGGFGQAQLGFAPDSGDLAADAASLGGDAYTVTGEVRPSSGAGLAGALTGTGPGFAPYTALATTPPSRLSDLADRLTAGARTPYQALDDIAAALRQDPYGLTAVPGFSYATMTAMLSGDPSDPGQSAQPGDAAQHASAFAVLAREEGLPVRIAVGYLLRDGKDGHYTVTTGDAYAWDQVYFQGYGWVDFDPTDPQKVAPGGVPPPKPATPQPQTPSPPIATVPQVVHPGPGSAGPGTSGDGGLAGLVLSTVEDLGFVLPAGFVLIALANLGGKTRRRRVRRRRGGARARISGAWREALDVLREYGLEVPLWLSAGAIAGWLSPDGLPDSAAGGLDLGAGSDRKAPRGAVETLRELAPLVEGALYRAAEPGPADVDAAWALERRLRRELYPGRARPRRLLRRALTLPIANRPALLRSGRPRRAAVRTGARL